MIADGADQTVQKEFEHFRCSAPTEVVTENRFVDVTLQIGFADYMISAENHAFEMPPEALYCIGCNPVTGVFLPAVTDYAVLEAGFSQGLVGFKFISEYNGIH